MGFAAASGLPPTHPRPGRLVKTHASTQPRRRIPSLITFCRRRSGLMLGINPARGEESGNRLGAGGFATPPVTHPLFGQSVHKLILKEVFTEIRRDGKIS